MNNMYKITYHSYWTRPQTFYTDSINELDEIVWEGKNSQYKVEVETCKLTSTCLLYTSDAADE